MGNDNSNAGGGSNYAGMTTTGGTNYAGMSNSSTGGTNYAGMSNSMTGGTNYAGMSGQNYAGMSGQNYAGMTQGSGTNYIGNIDTGTNKSNPSSESSTIDTPMMSSSVFTQNRNLRNMKTANKTMKMTTKKKGKMQQC